MTHNDFEEYKKAVKSKYELEKKGAYSSFLLPPSRANLRNLCAERFKESKSIDDLMTYKIFFGFEYEEGNINRLKKETGRFRFIENFFKGITDTNDIEGINIAAILVDFKPRPFRKFSKGHSQSDTQDIKPGSEEENGEIEEIPSTENLFVGNPMGVSVKKNRTSLKKKIAVGISIIVITFSVGYTTKHFLIPEKQCMQWQKDHYEPIECQSDVNSLFASAPIIPFDEDAVHLNRLEVCDTTTFFKGGKAVVWYCKVNGEPEYFDDSGFHPITGKSLRPVTRYIIDKYLEGK